MKQTLQVFLSHFAAKTQPGERPARRSFYRSLIAAPFCLFVTTGVNAADLIKSTSDSVNAAMTTCPAGWVRSSAPGGCSPEFFTLKSVGLYSTSGCPSGWVESAAPGGCSPEFFTLRLNGIPESIRSCPSGWVRSSAPGGCSPDYITLKQAGLEAIDSCPGGWVRSSAPGGCSPDNFTLETEFDGFDYARFHCPVFFDCNGMVDAIIALGGHCTESHMGVTCDLPPLIEKE